MKKFYIFDFDGTLVNTFYDSVIAYNKALEYYGLKQYEYQSLDEIDYTDFVNSMTDNMEVLEKYREIYETSDKTYTLPYSGTIETLEKLTDDGNEVAICSNRNEQQLMDLTNKLFPTIDFTYIVGYMPDGGYKPNPEMINRILDNVDYNKEEIIYIGDKTTDIKTAKNVNLDVIIVTWGQGDKEAYNNPYPIKIIDKMEELL